MEEERGIERVYKRIVKYIIRWSVLKYGIHLLYNNHNKFYKIAAIMNTYNDYKHILPDDMYVYKFDCDNIRLLPCGVTHNTR